MPQNRKSVFGKDSVELFSVITLRKTEGRRTWERIVLRRIKKALYIQRQLGGVGKRHSFSPVGKRKLPTVAEKHGELLFCHVVPLAENGIRTERDNAGKAVLPHQRISGRIDTAVCRVKAYHERRLFLAFFLVYDGISLVGELFALLLQTVNLFIYRRVPIIACATAAKARKQGKHKQ